MAAAILRVPGADVLPVLACIMPMRPAGRRSPRCAAGGAGSLGHTRRTLEMRERKHEPLAVAQLLVALLEDVEPLRLHRDLGDELGELLDLVLERGDLGRLLAHRLAHHLAVLAEAERHQAAAAEDADDLYQLERGVEGELVAHVQHPIFSPARLCTRTWRTVSAVSCFDA